MIFKNEDEKRSKRSKIEETDSFWDVGEITPPKRGGNKEKYETDSEAVLVFDDSREEKVFFAQPIKKPSESSRLLLEYFPDTPFVKKVSIFSWPSKYTFYERFRLDAQKCFNLRNNEVVPVKYFSYMPSYIQMSMRQREWYFYWRDCVRNKKYLPADSSYILLYIYEIINLPDIISPEKGLELICDIWENYRDSYTKLDKFLAEWVCDYCLVNNLPVPYNKIASFYGNVIDVASFKQFYFLGSEEEKYALLLLEKLSSYKWNKSKYIDDKNMTLFAKHVKGGFAYAVKKLALSDGRFDCKSGRLVEKTVVRDAFSGSLCSYNSKRKIEIEYIDVENVNDLTFIVTDMVRYCENRIRAYLGIRARLSVQNLTEEQKAVLNEYFDKELPCLYYEKRKKDKNDFEPLVEEIKPFEVSFEKAREIEEASWQITDRLVEFDEEEEVQIKENFAEEKSVESEALDIAKDALACIARNDSKGFFAIAEACYMLPETLAEVVNELCFEILGDIGVEERDGSFVLIPDYEEEIKQWLSK